jgi:formate-nitrite transporter family protein
MSKNTQSNYSFDRTSSSQSNARWWKSVRACISQWKFVDAIAGGVLVSLLSFLLEAANSVRDRITLAYIVGFLLALGPFDHVIVTVLHVFFGMLFGASIGVGTLARMTVIITAGNLVGGLGLVTLTHIAQARGARESDD